MGERILTGASLGTSSRSGETGYKCRLLELGCSPSDADKQLFSLDYNLDRFWIEDRKGLEIVLLSSIFSILQGDKLDEHTKDRADSPTLAPSPSPRPGVQRQPSDEVEAVSAGGRQDRHLAANSPRSRFPRTRSSSRITCRNLRTPRIVSNCSMSVTKPSSVETANTEQN